ncbi:uncharacterized protein [Anabrus simplex]|uniref:uncharacterized protein n=1 Tax=Anabrus simplex TaxID=316456 RepID=UPI0035A3CD2E
MLMFVVLGLLLIATSPGYKFTDNTSIKRVLVLDHVRCSEFSTFCPNGYSCIYWEEYCPSQPCRLFPFCRLTPEVRKWNEECREIGCSAEACFLRQRRDCDFMPCDFFADCVYTEAESKAVDPVGPVDPCQSYICPKGYTCQAKMEKCAKEECTAQVSCISTHRKRKLDARKHYAM